jgi:hypothetical protein
MERVYAAERTANEAPALAMTKRQIILKGNSKEILANKAKFDQTMEWWLYTRDNQQVRVIDKQNEDITQIDTTLADLDKVIMNQFQLVAAIARTPATKLMGTVPTGFNSTGDYEEASYNAECEGVQENDMQPLIERHHQILGRSAFRDSKLIVRAQFNPLDAPTEAERAESNFKKMQTYKLAFDMGAVDGVDVNEIIRTDPDMGMSSVTPAQRSPEEEMSLDDDGNPVRVIEQDDTPEMAKLLAATNGDDEGDNASVPMDD